MNTSISSVSHEASATITRNNDKITLEAQGDDVTAKWDTSGNRFSTGNSREFLANTAIFSVIYACASLSCQRKSLFQEMR